MAGNDEIAYGPRRSLRQKVLTAPKDMSVVGFNDRDEAIRMDRQLTTALVDKEELGQACMMLLERLRHPKAAFRWQLLPRKL